jgi:hypothetical protein
VSTYQLYVLSFLSCICLKISCAFLLIVVYWGLNLFVFFFILYQSSKGDSFSSHNNVANGTPAAGNGSSIKSQVPLETGPALSPDAYRRRHEITVTVSTYTQIYIYIIVSSLHSLRRY